MKQLGAPMAEPIMSNGGSVVTISSLTTRIPGPEVAVYSGARAGIDYAIRVAAQEYQEQRIRFNSIAAGQQMGYLPRY